MLYVIWLHIWLSSQYSHNHIKTGTISADLIHYLFEALQSIYRNSMKPCYSVLVTGEHLIFRHIYVKIKEDSF